MLVFVARAKRYEHANQEQVTSGFWQFGASCPPMCPTWRANRCHTGKPYSTCRRHNVDPQLYLTQLLINLPVVQMSELDAWLPNQWKIRLAAPMPVNPVTAYRLQQIQRGRPRNPQSASSVLSTQLLACCSRDVGNRRPCPKASRGPHCSTRVPQCSHQRTWAENEGRSPPKAFSSRR